jgi:predicted dehydrogenase
VQWVEESVETLKVGIVGAGWMGTEHAQAWRNNTPRGEIVAVADAAPARARQIAERFSGGRARVHATLDALLADPDVEAVDICLPHHLHAEAILAAARAGKAILCEKPLCTSLEDAAAIGAVLRETGVSFMSAHNQLFQPSLIEARRLLAAGVLGRPYVIRSVEAGQNRGFQTGRAPVALAQGESPWAWRTDPRRMGGGEVLDTGWHATYRLLALADERPVEVVAMLERYFVQELRAEDTGLLLVRFASGVIGEIVTSWAFGLVGGWQFEVAAEHGNLAGGRARLVHQLHGWPLPAERAIEPVHTFTAEVAHFLDVVQLGASSDASFEHAARVLQVTKAAYRSADERRSVALPEDPTEPGEPIAEAVSTLPARA